MMELDNRYDANCSHSEKDVEGFTLVRKNKKKTSVQTNCVEPSERAIKTAPIRRRNLQYTISYETRLKSPKPPVAVENSGSSSTRTESARLSWKTQTSDDKEYSVWKGLVKSTSDTNIVSSKSKVLVKDTKVVDEQVLKLRTERKLRQKQAKILRREERVREGNMSKKSSKVSVISASFLQHLGGNSPFLDRGNSDISLKTFADEEFPDFEVLRKGPQNHKLESRTSLNKPLIIKSTINKTTPVSTVVGNATCQDPIPCPTSPESSSYSSALLVTKSHRLIESVTKHSNLNSPHGVTGDNAKNSDQRRKVKRSDPIQLDLWTAIKTIEKAPPKLAQNKSTVTTRPTKSTSNLVTRGVTVTGIKRGKQRENQKKRLSRLKKNLVKWRLSQKESLCYILESCKNASDEITDSVEKCSLESEIASDLCYLTDSSQVIPVGEALKKPKCCPTEMQAVNFVLPLNSESIDSCNSEIIFASESGSQKFQNQVEAHSVEVTDESIKALNLVDSCVKMESTREDIRQELRKMLSPIHKKSFREYCHQVVTPEINEAAKILIEALVFFQDRQYHKDPLKASVRRRYICGLKETLKHINKMSCVIIAPNIQHDPNPGGLDEMVQKIIDCGSTLNVPIIFALNCRQLGRACRRKVPVSIFGITNYQGAQDKFQALMELVPGAQEKYQALLLRLGPPEGDMGLLEGVSE